MGWTNSPRREGSIRSLLFLCRCTRGRAECRSEGGSCTINRRGKSPYSIGKTACKLDKIHFFEEILSKKENFICATHYITIYLQGKETLISGKITLIELNNHLNTSLI